ncbi:MAG: butyrate kinase [Pseudomonadota bacterium]
MIRLMPLLERQTRAIHKPRPTVIFPEGCEPRVLAAASQLTGVANVVLVGAQEEARRVIVEQKVPLRSSLKRFLASARFLLPADEPALCEEFHEAFWERSQGSQWAVPYERAAQLVREPVMFACMAVHQGYADCVLGGVVHASRDFFRPALRLLHTERKAFSAALFSLPDEHPQEIYRQNIVVFADVAINVDPDADTLAQIAVGSCKIVRDLIPVEVLPHINGALLSYSTRGSASGPSVDRIRLAGDRIKPMLAELVAQDPLYGSIHIEAELQISCAISMAAAQSKLRDALANPDSPVGRANVLILPSLDAGNLMYHLYATRYPHSDKILMVGNMGARVLDYSRSSTAQDVALGAAAACLRIKRKPAWMGTPKDRFFPAYQTLVINPGSTSTRIGVYRGRRTVFEREIHHPAAEIAACGSLHGQLALRGRMLEAALAEAGIPLDGFDAFVGRGGLVRPLVSGTYRVNQAMLDDLASGRFGEHASNLGASLAHALAAPRGKPAFIVDPVVTDELDEVARLTGLAEYERRAVWHALSQKAAAKRFADEHLEDYEDVNLIVAHMGGGITVGCHRKGRVIEVTNGLDEGPMTPERAGGMPSVALMDLCLNHEHPPAEIQRRLVGRGGLVSHLGTNDMREVERRMDQGDGYAALVFERLAQDIARFIAGSLPRFEGRPVDAIILTGGLARSDRLVARLKVLLAQLPASVTVYPGALEGEALRDGALRVLRGQETALEY